MARKRREKSLMNALKTWLGKFGEDLTAAYYDKPKPAPKRRAKPKRKVVKKKKS